MKIVVSQENGSKKVKAGEFGCEYYAAKFIQTVLEEMRTKSEYIKLVVELEEE